MSLTETQQASTILGKTRSLLLVTPSKASIDAVASMIGLFLYLQQQDDQTRHRIDAVNPTHVPPALQFLGGSSQIAMEPAAQPEVIIEMAVNSAASHVHQEEINGGLRIHLTFPNNTTITKDQIETTVRVLPYDAIIVIGAADLEEIGPIFTDHADFFYNTPLINIDHRAANEHFGTVNLVDITAGSNAEVTHDLIINLSPKPIRSDVATALYAGIVAGTDSFQKPSTTPRSFQTAASLIENEADRESVIQHLVKTKPLKLIRLVGSVYAHLRHEESVGLYWTILEAHDFLESKATAEDIPSVMHELANNIAGFNAAFLLYETSDANSSNEYYAYLLLGNGLKQRRREIQEVLSATKENGALTFTITAPSIEAAEKVAHDKIKQIVP